MLHPADRAFMRRLLGMITDQDNECTLQVRAGSSSDYPEYRDRCGYLRALDDVRVWCNQIAESDDPNPDRST